MGRQAPTDHFRGAQVVGRCAAPYNRVMNATPLSVFDAHVDSLQRQLDLGHDLGVRGSGHLDCERGLEGGLGAVVLVSWVDPSFIEPANGGAYRRTQALLAEFHTLCEKHPGRIRIARNGSELEAANSAGCIAGIAGIEGGHSIEEDLGKLDWFFEQGVRMMTLVWNNHLSWIRSCQDGADASVPEGLSEFGRSVVRRMNELGMVIDLSHAGERAFYDTLETSTQPVIASHSACRALRDHPRNLTDDQLRALAAAGGVVGIVFCTPFLSEEAQRAERSLRQTDEYKAFTDENETARFVAQSDYLQRNAPPLEASVVLDHIVHAVEVAGIEHVGLGSDYDGIQVAPRGLEDASCYGAIARGLEERGFEERDVLAILGGNMRRVFAQVTR